MEFFPWSRQEEKQDRNGHLKFKKGPETIRARGDTIQWHYTNCAFIPKEAVSEYWASIQVLIASRGKESDSSAEFIRKHFGTVMTKKQQIELDDQVLRFDLSANISFIAATDYKMKKCVALIQPFC